MAQPPYPPQQPHFAPQPPAPQCYRHPGRVTYINCQRCGRPICPECMISAAVGFQCPACVSEGMRSTRQNQAPYGGERSKNPALTTIVLIAINAAVWVLILLTGGSRSPWANLLALRPVGICVSVDGEHYYPNADAAACSQLSGAALWFPGVADGAWWQPITNAFAHVEFWHIGFNMLLLWFVGPQLERMLGRSRFLALYLLSALASSATVMWLSSPTTSTLGASGAIFGLLGALLVLTLKVRGNVQNLLMWLGISVAFTFLGVGISWQGHLGGLAGGAAIAAIIAYAPKAARTRMQVVGLVGIGMLELLLILARVLQLM